MWCYFNLKRTGKVQEHNYADSEEILTMVEVRDGGLEQEEYRKAARWILEGWSHSRGRTCRCCEKQGGIELRAWGKRKETVT